MTLLLAVAWRNVWRNPFRSLILMGSVILGLWAGVFIIGFYQGMIEQRVRAGIEEVGHLQIHAPGFVPEYRASEAVPQGDSLARAIESRGLGFAAPRLLAQGMVSTARFSSGVEIRGVDSAAEAGVSRLPSKVESGTFFGDKYSHPVVIGRRLARKRGLGLGSKLVLTFPDSAGDLAAAAFRVAGLFSTADSRFDEGTVFVPRERLRTLLRLPPGEAHEIAVRLAAPAAVEHAADSLRSALPDIEVQTWRQIAPDLELESATLSQTLSVFMGIIMLGLAFGIVNTMLMAVLDRTREIGMLMALGMKRRYVFLMIELETVLLTAAGAPLGLGLAWATVAWLGHTGIDLGHWAEGLQSYGLATRVYPSLPAAYFGEVFAMVAITALIAAVYPARKALRLKPAEAVRAA